MTNPGTNQPIESYADFWQYYLREHSNPKTRAIHYVGTGVAIASLGGLIATGNDVFGLGALIGGYGFAWVGHFFIEKNRPATFTYPLWSLFSDFRMAFRWATGRLSPELAKAGVTR
jgi:hypothetical protein